MATITASDRIDGVFLVTPAVHGDDRGFFVETYRRNWFPAGREMIQGNRAARNAGAIVGLHYHLNQSDYWYVIDGHARVVLHDLRTASPTEGHTQEIDVGEVDGAPHNHLGVYIPPGVAHGFSSITDVTLTYLVDGYYNQADELGVAWDGHDAVVHFAAESHVDRSLLDPDVFVRTNCTGTNVVCDEARRVEVDRFLHVSTDEVYGSIDEGAFTETDPLTPSSPYSASKAGSDLIALSHHTSSGLPVVVTRSSNQFGPYQFPEKLIPYFVTTLLRGGNVPLYGDGLNVRDWLFVEDNCAALDLVLRTGNVGEVYNVGGHNERTNRQVTDAVLACLGLDDSRIDYVVDRPGHDRRYAVATEKVEALGHPRTRGFDQALEATVAWYVDNDAWWRPLVERVRNR